MTEAKEPNHALHADRSRNLVSRDIAPLQRPRRVNSEFGSDEDQTTKRSMEPIAYQPFFDGTRKPVYDDGKCRWVEEPDGTRVYGVWYVPREECDTPIIVGDKLQDDC